MFNYQSLKQLFMHTRKVDPSNI